MNNVPPDLQRPSQAKKKPYEPPRLEAYGDVAKITQAVGMTGSLDGGSVVGMRRTRA